jgi:mono/diheme cytochrome c family protein
VRKRKTQNSKRKTVGECRRSEGPPRQVRAPILKPRSQMVLSFAFCVLSFCTSGCKRDDMADQPRYKPFAPSTFFPDGASARPPVPNTVTRTGQTFSTAPQWADVLPATAAAPFPITEQDLRHGQKDFNIYCSPCHGVLGDGNGMIPDRGFLHPPSYHSDRLRNAPDAYFFNVITHGIGAMYPYNDRVSPDDRWRIIAYIRALQLSQHASPQDLQEAAR